jgi:type IX secretion system PorP/SprF family membrane protein
MNRIVLFFFVFSTIICVAQQDAQYSQYMYNTISINPAYAGSRDVMSVFGLHRTQWIGIDGAPETNNFSINTPLKNNSFGIGISITNDKIGPSIDNSVAFDFAYSISTSEKFKLSFGLKGTLDRLDINVSKLNPLHQNDPEFKNFSSPLSTNIGFGLFLYSNSTYFGLSLPNSIEINRYDDESVSLYRDKRSYYFITGHVMELSNAFKFKPSVVSKYTQGAPLQLDLSANFLYKEKILLGGAVRVNAAVSALLGYQIDESWFVGYGYDLDTTKWSNYNSGSHELFLRFELFKNYSKIVSPRFF